jgi:uncharacterized protein (DUF1919 family)
MVNKLGFAVEQKLAILLALNVDKSQITESIGISEDVLNEYLQDDDFLRIVNLFKEELEQEKAFYKFREKPGVLEYYVRHKLITLADTLSADIDYMHGQMFSESETWKPQDRIQFIKVVSDMLNVVRQMYRDLGQLIETRYRNEIEKFRAENLTGKEMTPTVELSSELMDMAHKALKSGEEDNG